MRQYFIANVCHSSNVTLLTSSALRVGRGAIAARLQADGWRCVLDAYRGDGRRYIVESDELLSAFLELEVTLL